MYRVTKLARAALPVFLLPLLLAACGAPTDPAVSASATQAKADESPNVFRGPVDAAVCGPGSMPETGLQGRTRSVEDVASGRANAGYQCNMELVGHEGTKALWQMAWYEDCAYYGIALGDGGVAVVDAHDTANPVRTATLMTGAMLDPWESLKVNEKRGLLAAVGPSVAGPIAFDVYDIKADCKNPAVTSVLPVNGVGHEGEWAPDGLTYYGSAFSTALITAIDVTDPAAPVPVKEIQLQTHGLAISDDGNRGYLAQNTGSDMKNGLTIIDLSQIQSRATNPSVPIVSRLTWDDGAVAQMTIPVIIGGKPYVIFIDEGGGVCCGITDQTPGMARIIDISDETHPFIVSYLRDAIDMTEHAPERVADSGASGFTYQGHYCGVPQREEPGVLACSYFWQGIRLFDIRDPYHPKEIAYFVPGDVGAGAAGAKGNASSKIRFVPDKAEVWFTDQGHGFMVAKVTNDAWPYKAVVPPVVTPAAPPAPDSGRFGGPLLPAVIGPLLGAALARRRRSRRAKK